MLWRQADIFIEIGRRSSARRGSAGGADAGRRRVDWSSASYRGSFKRRGVRVLGSIGFLNIHNAVNVSGTADTVIQNGGQVRYFGGGNYPNMQISGTAALGAANGLSQSAAIQMANVSAGTFDLNGFDQTAVSLSTPSAANQSIVQNSGTTTNTLTLNTKGNSTFNGAINGSINLTIAGHRTADSFRVQQLHRQHAH